MPPPSKSTHWQHFAACRNCGYALRNLPTTVCPECGQGFDPHDPATMYIAAWVNWLDRLFLSAPGWGSHVIFSLPLVMAIAASADLVSNGDVLVVSALMLVVLPFVWFVRFIAWLALRSYYGVEYANRRSWLGWIVGPACIAAAIVIWISET